MSDNDFDHDLILGDCDVSHTSMADSSIEFVIGFAFHQRWSFFEMRASVKPLGRYFKDKILRLCIHHMHSLH